MIYYLIINEDAVLFTKSSLKMSIVNEQLFLVSCFSLTQALFYNVILRENSGYFINLIE